MSQNQKKHVLGRVTIKGVRLSFPQVFEPRSYKDGEPKYGASVLIPKDGICQAPGLMFGKPIQAVHNGRTGDVFDILEEAKMSVLDGKFGKGEVLSKHVKDNNYCVRDGDRENRDEYADMMYVSAKSLTPPQLVDRAKQIISSPVDANGESLLYGGCYVNMVVTMWAQQAGNRGGVSVPLGVHASLDAIQFVAHAEAFGVGRVDVDEVFTDITDSSDDIDNAYADGDDDVM